MENTVSVSCDVGGQTLVIETGANNNRITVARWAVGSKEEKISN